MPNISSCNLQTSFLLNTLLHQFFFSSKFLICLIKIEILQTLILSFTSALNFNRYLLINFAMPYKYLIKQSGKALSRKTRKLAKTKKTQDSRYYFMLAVQGGKRPGVPASVPTLLCPWNLVSSFLPFTSVSHNALDSPSLHGTPHFIYPHFTLQLLFSPRYFFYFKQ